MFRLLIFLFLPIILFSQNIKIASYNVENFFDLNNDKTEYIEYIPNNKHLWNQGAFDAKLKNILKVINDLDAEKLILKIKDEVMFNFGKNIVKNVFDQNRIYIGLNYPMNKNLAFEAGYLNWFQQRPSGTDFYNRDIIRFSVFHTINLKK